MSEVTDIKPSSIDRIEGNKNDADAVRELSRDVGDLIAQCDGWTTGLTRIEASGNLSVRETRKLKTAVSKTRDALAVYGQYLTERAYDIDHREEVRAEKNLLKARINGATPAQMEAIHALLDGDAEPTEEPTEPATK